MERRIIGIDVGRARIGLAVSDPLGITAQPAGVIRIVSMRDTLRRLAEIAAETGASSIVVGLPLGMNGSRGEAARHALRFADAVRKSLGLRVVMWDERLTTVEADRLMKSAGLTRKQRSRRIDSAAAQIILQSYLDGHRHDEK